MDGVCVCKCPDTEPAIFSSSFFSGWPIQRTSLSPATLFILSPMQRSRSCWFRRLPLLLSLALETAPNQERRCTNSSLLLYSSSSPFWAELIWCVCRRTRRRKGWNESLLIMGGGRGGGGWHCSTRRIVASGKGIYFLPNKKPFRAW